jgi:hypothetical protein
VYVDGKLSYGIGRELLDVLGRVTNSVMEGGLPKGTRSRLNAWIEQLSECAVEM